MICYGILPYLCRRFTQVLRRSGSRLKRMLSKYDPSDAGLPQETSALQAQSFKVSRGSCCEEFVATATCMVA